MGEEVMGDKIRKHISERFEAARLEREGVRAECEAEFCPSWVAKATRDEVWRKAWEDGHSYGTREVMREYDELMDIVRTMPPK